MYMYLFTRDFFLAAKYDQTLWSYLGELEEVL